MSLDIFKFGLSAHNKGYYEVVPISGNNFFTMHGLMSIVLKLPAGDECVPWWTVIQIVDIHVECIIMKSSQCRLILHTVSALGPRNHAVASYC